MIAESVRRYLESEGVPYSVLPHSPRYTAQETAQSAHISGKHFAKTVVLDVPHEEGTPGHVLAVVPANEKVDLARLGERLGTPVQMATEDEISRLFPELEIGAIPPLGALAQLPVIADECLAHASWIVFHGGNLTDLIEMR